MAPNTNSVHDDEGYDVERILRIENVKETLGERIPLIEERETKKIAQQTKPTKDAKPEFAIVMLWLFFWLSNNVAVTLLNKATFSTFEFHYPFFLSFVHMVVGCAGAELCFLFSKHSPSSDGILLGGLTRHTNTRRESLILLAYSLVYSLNIAMGNVSLRYVSVNFNQMMRSLAPAITIFLTSLCGRTTSMAKKLAVIPVMVGVALSCLGDVEFTKLGFICTFVSVLLAGIKGVSSGEILTGSLKLHPIDLLSKLAPLAAVQCLIFSFLTGEVSSIKSRWATELSPAANNMPMIALLSTGFLAFSLNISSLTCVKYTSPLTLCIAGNAKQALMILMATVIFQTPVSLLNGIGLAVVLIGSSLYSYVSILEKKQSKLESSKNLIEIEKITTKTLEIEKITTNTDCSSTDSSTAGDSSTDDDDTNDKDYSDDDTNDKDYSDDDTNDKDYSDDDKINNEHYIDLEMEMEPNNSTSTDYIKSRDDNANMINRSGISVLCK